MCVIVRIKLENKSKYDKNCRHRFKSITGKYTKFMLISIKNTVTIYINPFRTYAFFVLSETIEDIVHNIRIPDYVSRMNKNAVFVHFELIFLLSVNANPYFCSRNPFRCE